MQHTAIDGTAKKRRAALWALCTALAVLCAVAVTYYWRVFYAYTAVPAVPLALCAAALALCGAVAVWACVYLCRSFAARAALAILLCGALFCFANPPMQAPDESTHFLRANAISMGNVDVSFSDVPEGSWYHDYVYLCASWGIIDGKENGQFCPTDSLKRGEFMKLLTLIGAPFAR